MAENPRPSETEQENPRLNTHGVSAEAVEGRGMAKGNPQEGDTCRMQGRVGVQQALERVRQAAVADKRLRFTSLLHHVYDMDALREAYFALKRDAAPGVDGQTWRDYGEELEDNLQDLSARLRRGAYRAKPTRRQYIPKSDGRLRPLGVAAVEDKLVQRAVTRVLNAVYEVDFLGFSYGFRPGRDAHNALDALSVGIQGRKVNWVLDADIRGFFDAIDREWLMRFVEHRIADRRIHRLILKWLNAGVLEEGVVRQTDTGTVQGGSISPLLANIYLHYAFDLWVRQWRERETAGDVIAVRYADDFVMGFQHKEDALRFLSALKERFAEFGLELHPEKTRLIEFGRWAGERRAAHGEGKPETFDFLGFTHICHKTRSGGRFAILRQTIRKRLTAKLSEIKDELRRRINESVPSVGKWLRSVVMGHFRYYGVPMNTPALSRFRHGVITLWHRTLRRRSHKAHMSWGRMNRLARHYIPVPRVCHPYPSQRLGVITQGRSRMR